MVHETLVKFGYPDSLIKEYEHWAVCLRPKQATLGALVLIAKSESTAFSSLSNAAFAEQKKIIEDIEATLSKNFSYNKINYLMLMMVDPQVHYHVLPRYDGACMFADISFEDQGWPGPPNLAIANDVDEETFNTLLQHLRDSWP